MLSTTLGQGKDTATLHELMNKMSWDPATLEQSVEENIKQEPYSMEKIKVHNKFGGTLPTCSFSEPKYLYWAGLVISKVGFFEVVTPLGGAQCFICVSETFFGQIWLSHL